MRKKQNVKKDTTEENWGQVERGGGGRERERNKRKRDSEVGG